MNPPCMRLHLAHLGQTLAGVALAGALSISSPAATAAAIDVVPGDYVALKPGDHAFTGYLYRRDAVGSYAGGTRTGNARVRANVVATRFSGFNEVAGMPWAWSVTPLWSKARLAEGTMPAAFGSNAAGSGDVRLSATLWPLADREKGEYLGITAAWFEPTGNYSNQRILNVGENRRKLAILVGWSTPLTSTLRLELTPELVFSSNNTDYLGGRKRSQDETLALTGYLRWRTAERWEINFGAQSNGGGETSVNDVPQNDVARNLRVMLGTAYFLDRNTVLSLRHAADVKIENGLRLGAEWQLRIGHRF